MVQDIIKKSTPAVCGISERTVRVAETNVKKTIAKLQNAGFYVIGTSLPGKKPKREIWFIRGGSL